MNKLVLLSALTLILPGRWAAAQSGSLSPQAPVISQAPLAVDSAVVLHQLFRQARHNGVLGLLASTGISNGITALNSSKQAAQIIGGIAVGANTGLLVITLVERVKFSRKREREALEQLRQHQPLRVYVQRSYALALLKAAKPSRD